MKGRELVEFVAGKRVEMIKGEVKETFPGAEIACSMIGEGRAHILIVYEGVVIGEEFVETGESWKKEERRKEYLRTLINKARLVIVVPERHVRSARMRLLEFNHWWLFYYLVFSYDQDGDIKHFGKPGPCLPERGYA
jgi:hypothetical protein